VIIIGKQDNHSGNRFGWEKDLTMNILKRIGSLFAPSTTGSADPGWYYYVKCVRCGEVVKFRINPMNDLSRHDDNTLFVRKGIVGRKCYSTIEVQMTFSSTRKLINTEISGGEMVSKAEFEAQATE
jgi:hypothetical protein